MAGATTTFFVFKCQALKMQVSKLSARPLEILAKVFADSGAIKSIDESFTSSM